MRKIKVGSIYKHFKGHTYYVIDIALDCETKDINNPDKIVIYKDIHGSHLTWARKYSDFASEVDHEKYPNVKQKYRFEEVDIE